MDGKRFPQILTRGNSTHHDSTADDGDSGRRDHTDLPVRILQSHQQSPPSHQAFGAHNRDSARPGASTNWVNSVCSDGRLSLPRKMVQPVKLVDNKWHWSAEPVEYLSDITDFLVVSVVGGQGVGKSFLASLLSGIEPVNSTENSLFQTADPERLYAARHETSACDLYVTPERIILLDNQPMLSASVMDEFIHYDRKIAYEYPSFESCVLMQSLQMFCFSCTVSHVIVYCFDNFLDEALLSVLQTGEMIKPDAPAMLSSVSPESVSGKKYTGWPRLVFLYNKCPSSLMNYSSYCKMQEHLYSRFESSKFSFNDGCGSKMLPIFSTANNTRSHSYSDVNLLLLPDVEKDPTMFSRASSVVRSAVLASPRIPFYTKDPAMPMSELTWHQFATKAWEGVKRSKLFDDYTKMLP